MQNTNVLQSRKSMHYLSKQKYGHRVNQEHICINEMMRKYNYHIYQAHKTRTSLLKMIKKSSFVLRSIEPTRLDFFCPNESPQWKENILREFSKQRFDWGRVKVHWPALRPQDDSRSPGQGVAPADGAKKWLTLKLWSASFKSSLYGGKSCTRSRTMR